jgi:alanyl-tRNA synthetase
MKTSFEIQESFIHFFESKGHRIVKTASLVPHLDKTLLFTNAGMNQFKEYFVDTNKAPFESATSAQRCVRAGGKHNDLDQVGFTKRHLTSFTMLGNFSFRSYFKKEAIIYAWEYLTTVLKLEKETLWVTVFQTDDEAYQIWHETIGVPKEKIFRLGEKDNFWQMGDVGPCGPCSEIYVDRGIQHEQDVQSFPGDDRSTRFMEIWNLVFMEYERNTDGTLTKLAQPGIDTGMGLERIASVIQKVDSVFHTDLFIPLCKKISDISGVSYHQENQGIFHVLADHIRTVSLLIYYGVRPSNEGRGYVLRKIMRRALLFSQKISQDIGLFASLVSTLVSSEKLLCADLKEQEKEIEEVILEESKKFFSHLESGLVLFKELRLKQKETIFSGKDAFYLYDTCGFPLEITKILCQEAGIALDEVGYQEALQEQRERSQKNQKFKTISQEIKPKKETKFFGYEKHEIIGTVQEIFVDGESVDILPQHKEGIICFDQTVIYPTGGGQICDSATIKNDEQAATVIQAKKYDGKIGITVCPKKAIRIGTRFQQTVDRKTREETERHHSAVHMLYNTIERYFKTEKNMKQVGSFVCADYFTIDLTIKTEISYQDKTAIEDIMNREIHASHKIHQKQMTLEEAQRSGATADFEEKYDPKNVRVIIIENVTADLCGGCHATNTSELKLSLLKEITTQGTGIKRFLGVVSDAAFSYLREIEKSSLEAKKLLCCPITKIEETIKKKTESATKIEKEKEEILKLLAEKQAMVNHLQNKHQKHIMFEIDPLLKGYEENMVATIKDKYEKILLWIEMKPETFFISGYIKEIDDRKRFEENLTNKYSFKGRIKNGFFKGIVETDKKNIENIIA